MTTKYWHDSFSKLTREQMLALKHQEDAPRPTKPELERGTAKPSNDQMLKLLWRFNENKPSRWL